MKRGLDIGLLAEGVGLLILQGRVVAFSDVFKYFTRTEFARQVGITVDQLKTFEKDPEKKQREVARAIADSLQLPYKYFLKFAKGNDAKN